MLAVADGTPRNPLTRRRNPAGAAAGLLRRLVWHKFGLLFTALLAVIGIGFGLLAVARYSLSNTIYLGLMDLTGSALTSPADSGAEKTAQVLLTLDGMAFIPVITAIARALRDDLRIVLRLTDDDLAERLQKTTGNIISRSVPYLAPRPSPPPCSNTRFCAPSPWAATCY